MAIVRKSWSGSRQFRKAFILLTFDVRNAFNSVGWEDMLNALKTDFNVDQYILDIGDDYFRDRSLEYEGTRALEITAGVPQSAVVGPDFWNAQYGDLLATDFMRDTHVVGYADDIAGIVIADSTEDARRTLGHLTRRIGWAQAQAEQPRAKTGGQQNRDGSSHEATLV